MKKGISLFAYFGAKTKLAEQLTDFIETEKFDTFIDGFTGAGSIILNNTSTKRNICNDLDVRIYFILKILSDPKMSYEFIQRMYDTRYDFDYYCEALEAWEKYDNALDNLAKRKIEAFNFISKHDFNKSNDAWKEIIPEDKMLELAVYALAIFKQTKNGITNRKNKITMWKGFVDGTEGVSYIDRMLNLMDASEALHNVEVYNVNTLTLIDMFRDDEKACIYLDPPYEMKTRGKSKPNFRHDYKHEMTNADQLNLISVIKDMKPRILLSGYRDDKGHSIYDELLIDSKWHTCLFSEVTKSSAYGLVGESKPTGEEHVWYNW